MNFLFIYAFMYKVFILLGSVTQYFIFSLFKLKPFEHSHFYRREVDYLLPQERHRVPMQVKLAESRTL